MKEENIHKIQVKDLVGASYKGKYCEVKIDDVSENVKINCRRDCFSFKCPPCSLKRSLMERQDKLILTCTAVIVRIKNISTRPFNFATSSESCQAIDSQGNLYRTLAGDDFSQTYIPPECREMFKEKFGTFYSNRTEIPDGASARFLLLFPPIPNGSKITRLIIKGCINYPSLFPLETFDFRVADESTEMVTQGKSDFSKEEGKSIRKDLSSSEGSQTGGGTTSTPRAFFKFHSESGC